MTRRRGERFHRAHRFRKGYSRKQVDAFLARADLALQGALPGVTATDIRRAGFELVRRGYEVEEVDAALDEMELQAVHLGTTTSRRGRLDPTSDAAYLRQELSAPYMQRFPRVRFLRRGYDLDDVDDFLDRVCAALDRTLEPDRPDTRDAERLDVAEVRTVAFRPRRGGYSEDAVDEALDRVVEMMLLMRAAPQPPDTRRPPEGSLR